MEKKLENEMESEFLQGLDRESEGSKQIIGTQTLGMRTL